MRFVRLKTLLWHPSWYQKYSCSPKEIQEQGIQLEETQDLREELAALDKNRESRWRVLIPWWQSGNTR